MKPYRLKSLDCHTIGLPTVAGMYYKIEHQDTLAVKQLVSTSCKVYTMKNDTNGR